MDSGQQILSDIIIYMKYAKYLPDKKRRETWPEIVTRNKEMHKRKYPMLANEIDEVYKLVYDKKVLPSLRSLQFAGRPIELSLNRIMNCSYMAIDNFNVFSELMFLLLGGSGCGYSVQQHHVDRLPEIRKPMNKKRRYLINDSIEGWADAIDILMRAYFEGNSTPIFDFGDIRPKGTLLVTSGGKAPGPEPLKDCLHNIQRILDRKNIGEKLKPIECHDIICFIALAVKSGGIRRASLISLFSADDEEMITCKFGNWRDDNPQRAMANNSVVLLRHRITEDFFFNLWEKVRKSNSGEPGFYFTNNRDIGCNPCAEASLKDGTFCNLTTMDINKAKTQEDLNIFAKACAFIGTLQAGYTDFHYLREHWKTATERDALLGVSMTGVASNKFSTLNLTEAAKIVLEENQRIAEIIGIKQAARTCLLKPEGTASLLLSTSSGVHAWFAPYYIRRIRVGKDEAIYKYLLENEPGLVVDDYFKPTTDAIIEIPLKAPEDAIFRTESPLNLLERVKYIHNNWIKPGHRSGDNTHAVSCTVYIKDDEWDVVGKWMWNNRNYYSSISVLPFDGGSYVQTPFEEIDKETYDKLSTKLYNIDLSKIKEDFDNTNLVAEPACAGGQCEL